MYVTVGNDFKKQTLMKKYPCLTDDCFASSRTTEFENMIKRQTNGKGVDLVLNSLADDKLQVRIIRYLHNLIALYV